MIPEYVRSLPAQIRQWVSPNIHAFLNDHQPRLWVLSLGVGVASTIAAIIFRELIGLVQLPWLGDRKEHVVTAALQVPWYFIVLAPMCGGLVVGIMLQTLVAQRRTMNVADVIEARAFAFFQPEQIKCILLSA